MAKKKKAGTKRSKKKPAGATEQAPASQTPDDHPQEYEHSVRCKFGSGNMGKNTVSIGVDIPRADLPLPKADKLFMNSQLQVEISIDPNSTEDPAQDTLIDEQIWCAFNTNVSGMGLKQAGYHISLAVPKTACSLDDLGKFNGCWGIMKFTRKGAAVQDTKEAA